MMIARGPNTPEYSDEQIDDFLTTPQGAQLANMMKYTAVGTPDDVRDYLTEFAAGTKADELIIAHASQQLDDRLRSVELTATAMGLGAVVAA